MANYTQVDQGTVVAGQMRQTSFTETASAGEIGLLIRFANKIWTDVNYYAVKKSFLPFVSTPGIADYPLLVGNEVKIWSPTCLFPVSMYYSGARTLLYFPKDSPVVGTTFRLYRVTS